MSTTPILDELREHVNKLTSLLDEAQPSLDTLREHSTKLKRLLDDAHPGLVTWATMYGKEMQWLNNFWNQEEALPNARVWKFPLKITDIQNVMMPEGARVLTVQMQHGELCMWALVNPDAPKQRREIEVIGTGNPMPDAVRRYIGTAQQLGGQLIWHVFERA